MLGLMLGCMLVVVAVFAATNVATIATTKDRIVEPQAAVGFDADAIVVLGASVFADGTPSGILRDRLDDGIALYKEGVAPKLIMSGDNSTVSYNEVQVMKDYAISQGVPSYDIFCDHAGFSTYESMYRAKHVFGAERIVRCTPRRVLASIPSAWPATTMTTPSSSSTICARSPRARRTSSRRCSRYLRRSWATPSASISPATSPRADGECQRCVRRARFLR